MSETLTEIASAQLSRRLFLSGIVRQTTRLTPRIVQLVIRAETLADTLYRPGQHVRVKVGKLRNLLSNGLLRTYSIAHLDRTTCEMSLWALDHPGRGPGARWAGDAQPGDPVLFRAPEGKFVIRAHAGFHLFVGDETTVAAFNAIMAALPPDAKTAAIIVTGTADDRIPLARDVIWVRRDPQAMSDAEVACGALRSFGDFASGRERTAYIAGEARSCKAVRRLLVDELGWSSAEVLRKPFWTPGARGFE